MQPWWTLKTHKLASESVVLYLHTSGVQVLSLKSGDVLSCVCTRTSTRDTLTCMRALHTGSKQRCDSISLHNGTKKGKNMKATNKEFIGLNSFSGHLLLHSWTIKKRNPILWNTHSLHQTSTLCIKSFCILGGKQTMNLSMAAENNAKQFQTHFTCDATGP